MTMHGTIVLPIAGRSSRFPGTRPKWMLTAPTGELMLQLALDTVPDWRERRVVVGGLREHLETLSGATAIRRALGDGIEIVVFDRPTSGPADTVNEMLRRADVRGPIFVKDCDSWFKISGNVFDDLICLVDLRETEYVPNIPAKSFVLLNENDVVAGIVEKSVSSNYVSVGGYGFHDVEVFIDRYRRLMEAGFDGEPFISHVILEAIRRGTVFRGLKVSGYQDVGTLDAWHRLRERAAVYVVDLDGVVFGNSGAYTAPFWDDPERPLSRNIEYLRQLCERGAQLIFLTARPERYREKTEAALRQAGLTWHAAIFDVNHARRILVNDFAPTNPYPSAVAVNIPRDEDKLEQFIRT